MPEFASQLTPKTKETHTWDFQPEQSYTSKSPCTQKAGIDRPNSAIIQVCESERNAPDSA